MAVAVAVASASPCLFFFSRAAAGSVLNGGALGPAPLSFLLPVTLGMWIGRISCSVLLEGKDSGYPRGGTSCSPRGSFKSGSARDPKEAASLKGGRNPAAFDREATSSQEKARGMKWLRAALLDWTCPERLLAGLANRSSVNISPISTPSSAGGRRACGLKVLQNYCTIPSS